MGKNRMDGYEDWGLEVILQQMEMNSYMENILNMT